MNNLERIIYRTNGDDLIVFVDDSWDQFAISNEAPELEAVKVIGRSLWDFVSDELTRDIYRQLLLDVRKGRSLTFDFRCDSPDRRRFLEMRMTPFADDGVQFETLTTHIEDRLPQELYRRTSAFIGEIVIACSWCKKIETAENVWHEVEQAVQILHLFDLRPGLQLSHGMCKACYDEMTSKLTMIKPRA